MKIAISSAAENLEAQVDPRFGRAAYFIIYNDSDHSFTALQNAAYNAMSGGGIQAAQFIINQGAKVVITGNCGPNAFRVLNESGLRIYQAFTRSVQEALDDFNAGKLGEILSPSINKP